jgi:hypothetical protein
MFNFKIELTCYQSAPPKPFFQVAVSALSYKFIKYINS